MFSKMMSSAFEVTPEQERERQAKKVAKRQKAVLDHTIDIATKKRWLLQKIEERDGAIEMASSAFEAAEYDRIGRTHQCLKKYVEMERASLQYKSQLLSKLEEAINGADVTKDITMFVEQEKSTDLTHKYHKALSILDWDYRRRKAAAKSFSSHRESEDVTGINDFMKPRTPAVRLSDVGAGAFDLLEGHVGNKDIGQLDSALLQLGVLDGTLIEDSKRKFSFIESPKEPVNTQSEQSVSSSSPDSQKIRQSGVRNSSTDSLEKEGDTVFVDNDPSEDMADLGGGSLAQTDHKKALEIASVGHTLENVEGSMTIRSVEDNYIDRISSGASSVCEVASIKMASQLAILFGDNDADICMKFGETDDLWTEIIVGSKDARDVFLQELDEKRGSHGRLSRPAFRQMTLAMKAMLDFCEHNEEVRSAMRVANMANTFHTTVQTRLSQSSEETNAAKKEKDENKQPSSPSEGDGGLSAFDIKLHTIEKEAGEVCEDEGPGEKHYIQQEPVIKDHPIWREETFWDAALIQGVAEELEHRDAVLWDELPPDQLREVVVGMHNIIFGQLGTMAVTMHEVGLGRVEVQRKLLKLCRGAQLTEEQENDLSICIKSAFAADDEDGGDTLSDALRRQTNSENSEATDEPKFGDGWATAERQSSSSNTDCLPASESGGWIDRDSQPSPSASTAEVSNMTKSPKSNTSSKRHTSSKSNTSEDQVSKEGICSPPKSRRPSILGVRLDESPVKGRSGEEMEEVLKNALRSPSESTSLSEATSILNDISDDSSFSSYSLGKDSTTSHVNCKQATSGKSVAFASTAVFKEVDSRPTSNTFSTGYATSSVKSLNTIESDDRDESGDETGMLSVRSSVSKITDGDYHRLSESSRQSTDASISEASASSQKISDTGTSMNNMNGPEQDQDEDEAYAIL
jgi:hypothetical protein